MPTEACLQTGGTTLIHRRKGAWMIVNNPHFRIVRPAFYGFLPFDHNALIEYSCKFWITLLVRTDVMASGILYRPSSLKLQALSLLHVE